MFRLLARLLLPSLEWAQIDMGSESLKAGRFSLRRAFRDVWIDRNMPVEIFERVLPVLRSSKILHLQGWGEPLLNPDFFTMATMARKAGCLLTTAVSDPDLLDDNTLELLVSMQFFAVTLNISSINEDKNMERRGTSLNSGFRALENLARIKKRLGSNLPKVMLLYTLHRSSLDELPRLPGLLHNLGVDKLLVNPLIIVPDAELVEDTLVPNSEAEYLDLERRMLSIAESARKRSMGMHYFLLNAAKNPPFCIENVTRALYLGAMGDISPCIFSQLRSARRCTTTSRA